MYITYRSINHMSSDVKWIFRTMVCQELICLCQVGLRQYPAQCNFRKITTPFSTAAKFPHHLLPNQFASFFKKNVQTRQRSIVQTFSSP